MPIPITQVQAAWSTLIDAPDRARTVAAEVRDQVAAITHADHLAEEYKRETSAQWRAHGGERLAGIRHDVDQAAELLHTAARENDQPGSDTAQLLAETRTQRAWSRLRGLLESGRSWEALVTEAEQRGDRDAVRALSDELPSYLRAAKPAPGIGQVETDPAAVAERLDVAAVRVFGKSDGPGRAASLRLHVAARLPVAVAALDATSGEVAGRGDTLTTSIATHYAEQSAARIEAMTAAPAAA